MSQEKPINVLLVEDDDVDVMNVKRALRQNGRTRDVWVARDGMEALARLRSGDVPTQRLLVLLDLNMPRMNGIELLQELRRDESLSWLPVVVLTTSDEERDKVDAYGLNVAGYLVKPVTHEAFVELVSRFTLYWSSVEMPDHGRRCP